MDINKAQKILIIRLSSLGDILLTTPLVRTIKINYSPIQIDFLLREQYKDALVNNRYISNLRLYSRDSELNKELLELLKHQNYDLIIDLQNNARSGKITSALNIECLKFEKYSIKKFLLVNFKINKLSDLPPIPVRYANAIPNFSLDDKGLDLFTSIKPQISKDKDKCIGFAPGSRHYTKMWPKDYFINLGKSLEDRGFKIVLFGGKDDKNICAEIGSELKNAIDLSNNDDILQTAADMKECKAIICNDSGLMHTACAENIPVLAIFGSTVKEFGFTPYKNSNLILENNSLSCRPCSHIGRDKCPKRHFKCMLELTPELAIEKLNELIEN